MKGKTLEILLNRINVREFRPLAVPPEVQKQLLEAALHAPAISGLQVYSIIVVDNRAQRERLIQTCGCHPWLQEAPLMVIFCVDTYRLKYILEQFKQEFYLANPLMLLLGMGDAMTAAQNMCIAAESQGLGSVYVGDILNDACRIQEILELPTYVFPIAMLCLGYPALSTPQPPRLKKIIHKDRYQQPGPEHVDEFKTCFGHLWNNDGFQFQKSRDFITLAARKVVEALLQAGFLPAGTEKEKEEYSKTYAPFGLGNTIQVIRQAQRIFRSRCRHPFSRANFLYTLAQFYLLRKQPERALQCFKNAILLTPEGAELYCCLGIIHRYLGNKKRSLEYFQKAVSLENEQPYFHLWLGETQAWLGQTEPAKESFTTTLNLNPRLVQAWLAKAKLLEQEEAWEEALACYRQAETLTPRDPTLLNNMAVLLLRLQRTTEAKRYCDKAFRLNPRDPAILANMGLLLSKVGEYQKAIECYNRALKSEPGNVDLLNNKGYCLMAIKRYQEALAIYELGLELNPGDLNLLENKASCLTLLDRHEEALRCYDEILQQLPQDPAILNNKALCLTKLGRYRQAFLCYQKALDEDPTNPIYLGNIAACLVKMEHYQEALAYYNQALQAQSGNPSLLSGKGVCLDYLGRFDEALDCYNHALRLV